MSELLFSDIASVVCIGYDPTLQAKCIQDIRDIVETTRMEKELNNEASLAKAEIMDPACTIVREPILSHRQAMLEQGCRANPWEGMAWFAVITANDAIDNMKAPDDPSGLY